MTPAAIMLVLASAVLHATWNLAAKRAGTGGAALAWLVMIVGGTIYAPLGIAAIIVTRPPVIADTVLAVLGTAVLHIVYVLLLQRGYAVGDLSVVYPLARGTGPLLSVGAAIVLLGERPGLLGIAGAACVVAGILIVSTGRTETTTSTNPQHARLAGAGYGLATGVLIAAYTLWDARAVATLGLSPLAYDWAADVARSAILTPYAARRWDRIREVWRNYRREVLIISVLSPLSYMCVLIAFTLAPVSLVAPARELSIVIASLFGWLLLREPQPLRRLAGAAVVLGGVVVLAAA